MGRRNTRPCWEKRTAIPSFFQLPACHGRGGPEWVDTGDLILLEVGSDAPALIIGQRMSILLEQRVDAGNTTVPGVLQVLRSAAVGQFQRMQPLAEKGPPA